MKILRRLFFCLLLVQLLGEVTICPDPLTGSPCTRKDLDIESGELLCLAGGGCDDEDLDISAPGDIFCEECKVKSIQSEGNINCVLQQSCTRGFDPTANPSIFADGNVHCFGGSSCFALPLINSGKDVLCQGSSSCARAGTIEAGGDIFCVGFSSCQFAEVMIAEGNIFCSENGACSGAQITAHGDVTCTGGQACSGTHIEGCNVFCGGDDACESGDIKTIGGNDHSDGNYGSCGTVICAGSDRACRSATINTYTLQCLGDTTCREATITVSNLKAEGDIPLQKTVIDEPKPITCKGELCQIAFAGATASDDDPVYTIKLTDDQSLLFSCIACSNGVKFMIDEVDCHTHQTSSDCRNIECFPFDNDNECDPYNPGDCGIDGFECFYNVEKKKINTEDQSVSPYYSYEYDNYYGEKSPESHEGIVCDSFNGTKCVSPIDSNDFVFCREEKCIDFIINARQILCIDNPIENGCSRSSLHSDNYVYCWTGGCNDASIEASRNIFCAGTDACTGAARIQSKIGNFFASGLRSFNPVANNVGKILVEENVYCAGKKACENSFIEAKSNSVHCTQEEACIHANIESPRNVLCSSKNACNDGRVNSCNTFCLFNSVFDGCMGSRILSILPRATSEHSVPDVYGHYPPKVRASCERPTIVCRQSFKFSDPNACNMASLVGENILCLSSDDGNPVEPTCVDSYISASNLVVQDLGSFKIQKLTCLETSPSCDFNFIGTVENPLMINLNPNQEIDFYCQNCKKGVMFNFRTPCYESVCIPVTCKDSSGKCSPNECQGMIKCSGGGVERSQYVYPPIFLRRPKLRMCTNEDYLAGRTRMKNKSGEKIYVLGVTGWGELTKNAESKVN